MPNHKMIALGLVIAHAVALALLLFAASLSAPSKVLPLMVATAIADTRLAPAVVQEPKIRMISIGIGPPAFEISEDLTMAMAAPAATGGCALSDAVQAALAASAEVRAALGLVPPNARSVSGATLLWDRDWADAAVVGGNQVLKPIQAIVVATVRATPADCRDAPVTGPRLAFVPDAGEMRILGFGSGVWKWSQLLQRNPEFAAGPAAKLVSQK